MEHISPLGLYLLKCSLLFLAYKAPNIEEVYIGLPCPLSMWYVMLKPAQREREWIMKCLVVWGFIIFVCGCLDSCQK